MTDIMTIYKTIYNDIILFVNTHKFCNIVYIYIYIYIYIYVSEKMLG